MTLCAVPVDDVAVAYNLHTLLLLPSQTPGSDQQAQSENTTCSFRFLLGPSDDDKESRGTFANICMSVVHRLHSTWVLGTACIGQFPRSLSSPQFSSSPQYI
jgi:hypothetical protein